MTSPTNFPKDTGIQSYMFSDILDTEHNEKFNDVKHFKIKLHLFSQQYTFHGVNNLDNLHHKSVPIT